MNDIQQPELSVMVAVVSDTTRPPGHARHLEGCLEALRSQVDPPTMEILVPHHPWVEGIEEAKARFPEARFLPVHNLETYRREGGGREHHDELRARGLSAATGRIVALLEDHARPDAHWCRAIIRAHERPYAAIGGAMDNGVDRALNWAVYFCDFARYQNPLPAGPSHFASDANVSYKRETLNSISSIWQKLFREPEVNAALEARGEVVALSPDIVVYQHRSGFSLSEALAERFVWGRSYAAGRARFMSFPKRLIYALLSPVLPLLLLARMVKGIWARGRTRKELIRALPYLILLLSSWALGEMAGYLRGKA